MAFISKLSAMASGVSSVTLPKAPVVSSEVATRALSFATAVGCVTALAGRVHAEPVEEVSGAYAEVAGVARALFGSTPVEVGKQMAQIEKELKKLLAEDRQLTRVLQGFQSDATEGSPAARAYHEAVGKRADIQNKMDELMVQIRQLKCQLDAVKGASPCLSGI